MRGPFQRLFGRSPAAPAFIESRLERLASYPPMPPPPPATPPLPPSAPKTAAEVRPTAPGRRQVKLILADGSESALPADPDLAARADYLVKSMLPPRPPAPETDGPPPETDGL